MLPNSGNSTADEMDATANVEEVAQSLIVRDDGKVLGVSRGDDSDEFTPPGGHVEPSEEPIKAAARELKEETGLDTVTSVPIFSRENDGRMIHVFLCHARGKIESSDEGRAEWITPEKLASGMYGEFYVDLFRSIGLEITQYV